MKKLMLGLAVSTLMLLNAVKAQTNDFYDDAETVKLKVPVISVEGEIANPGKVDFVALPMHSVVVKETLLKDNKDQFVGSYRYDGYSLYDILNLVVLKKKNEATFPPIIDLYVEVENQKGEKVVLSWGEIYYPIHRHEILIATQVARIVPSKTKELWPLPQKCKLVVASDLLTHRNISEPVKITIKSYGGDFVINKGMKPMYAPAFTLTGPGALKKEYNTLPGDQPAYLYPAVFYGRGTGIHGTTPFKGVLLKDLIGKELTLSEPALMKGLVIVAGKDGYHATYTFSELMNRNDQAEVLLVTTEKDEDGGYFKLFPAADFFSDRAIKSVESIRFVLGD